MSGADASTDKSCRSVGPSLCYRAAARLAATPITTLTPAPTPTVITTPSWTFHPDHARL